MSPILDRRAFITVASAGLLTGLRIARGEGQSPWHLDVQVVAGDLGFDLRIEFVLDGLSADPLYIEIANQANPDMFFAWERITESSGVEVQNVGPFGIPEGASYDVSLVTADGERHPRSPFILIDVPRLPGVL